MSHYKLFQSICRQLFRSAEGGGDDVSVFDPTDQFKSDSDEPAKAARRLNAAFILNALNKGLDVFINLSTTNITGIEFFTKFESFLHKKPAVHSDNDGNIAAIFSFGTLR